MIPGFVALVIGVGFGGCIGWDGDIGGGGKSGKGEFFSVGLDAGIGGPFGAFLFTRLKSSSNS